MRRTIEALGDRLLQLVAPRIDAGACLPPAPANVLCACPPSGTDGTYKICHYTCAGHYICGACYSMTGRCD